MPVEKTSFIVRGRNAPLVASGPKDPPKFVDITHADDNGNPVTVSLPNDNRVNEYKRGLRENGKHFTTNAA